MIIYNEDSIDKEGSYVGGIRHICRPQWLR